MSLLRSPGQEAIGISTGAYLGREHSGWSDCDKLNFRSAEVQTGQNSEL
jgi:hypothetical protein